MHAVTKAVFSLQLTEKYEVCDLVDPIREGFLTTSHRSTDLVVIRLKDLEQGRV